MKIVSWNINSIKIRLPIIKRFLDMHSPSIICFQETKVQDQYFPYQDFVEMGYPYICFTGEKSYNGVAIIANIPIKINNMLNFINQDKRHISVIIKDKIIIHNFYIPAGGDIPDISLNDKFKHKLDYCDQMTSWLKENHSKDDQVILLGDLNIAPLKNDVWSHKQLQNVVSHTDIEREKLNNIYKTLEFCDAIRKSKPESEKIFSWWSYRNKDWKKSNRGRRLDHIWITNKLNLMMRDSFIFSEAREWERPSDHVPVVLEMESLND